MRRGVLGAAKGNGYRKRKTQRSVYLDGTAGASFRGKLYPRLDTASGLEFAMREDGALVITNYKEQQTMITVPARIGKSAVTAIGKEVFSPFHDMVCRGREFFRTITEITLPDSIVEIGERAFDECKALRSVNTPEGVVGIGKLTAIQCTALELVKLPRSLKAIAEGSR